MKKLLWCMLLLVPGIGQAAWYRLLPRECGNGEIAFERVEQTTETEMRHGGVVYRQRIGRPGDNYSYGVEAQLYPVTTTKTRVIGVWRATVAQAIDVGIDQRDLSIVRCALAQAAAAHLHVDVSESLAQLARMACDHYFSVQVVGVVASLGGAGILANAAWQRGRRLVAAAAAAGGAAVAYVGWRYLPRLGARYQFAARCAGQLVASEYTVVQNHAYAQTIMQWLMPLLSGPDQARLQHKLDN